MKPAAKTRWSWILKWISTVLLVGVVAGTWFWQCQSKGQEIQNLPAQERGALYQRTIDTLRTTCTHPPGAGFQEYCREQADFVLQFPECDDTCQQLVKRLEPRATR